MSEKMSNIDIGDLPNISQSLLECTSPNGARTQEAQCSTSIRTQGQQLAQQREKRNRARNVDKKRPVLTHQSGTPHRAKMLYNTRISAR